MRGFWFELLAICVIAQVGAALHCSACEGGLICSADNNVIEHCPNARPCSIEEVLVCKELVKSAGSRLPHLFPQHVHTDECTHPIDSPIMERRGELNKGFERDFKMEDLLSRDFLEKEMTDIIDGRSGKNIFSGLDSKLKEKIKKLLKEAAIICEALTQVYDNPTLKKICVILKTLFNS